jgi:aspartate/methionine/tyrosine aminotransferase
MTKLRDFEMERWQSTYEYQVAFNLSESGVHPVALGKLLEMGGVSSINDLELGYGQSNGTEALRARIAALYPGATVDNITVTNGSAEANFISLWHLVEPGDDVVVIMPTYMQTVGLIESLGGNVREVWLREENEWQPDPNEIDAAVSDRTRAIVVTNPNNPTGAIMKAATRRAIQRAAERVGAWILADEVYTGAEVSGVDTPSFWAPGARVLATAGLSKAYGLPGLRIGWVVSPDHSSERIWSRKDYTTIAPGSLTDRLATVALDSAVRPKLLQRTRSRIRSGFEATESWLNETGVFRYRPPEAGAIVFARYDLPINSSDLAERLRVEQSVLIVPGDHFKLDHYIRFGFGLPANELHEALQRVSLGLMANR